MKFKYEILLGLLAFVFFNIMEIIHFFISKRDRQLTLSIFKNKLEIKRDKRKWKKLRLHTAV